jgi:hypothetical protein
VPYKFNFVHPQGSPDPDFTRESQPDLKRKPGQRSSSLEPEPEPAIGGPVTIYECQESDIQKAIAWFAQYLAFEREEYYERGDRLSAEWRDMMKGYFDPSLLDEVRLLELVGQRVANPWFYPKAREKGLVHMPDVTHKAAITFLDVVVFNERIGSRDLFHGLVHAAQVRIIGVQGFTELFVRGFLRARSYFLVPMKAHAFALDARFAASPGVRFSVENEIRAWWRAGKY